MTPPFTLIITVAPTSTFSIFTEVAAAKLDPERKNISTFNPPLPVNVMAPKGLTLVVPVTPCMANCVDKVCNWDLQNAKSTGEAWKNPQSATTVPVPKSM